MNGIRPLLRTVGSLWFAAVLLVLLMVAMGSATVFETRNGTDRTLMEFYHAPWFRLLLGLVAINVLAAVLARYPFNRKQIGFLLTHGGILLTLAGALATKYYNVDGRASIVEGETIDSIDTHDPVLEIEDRKRERSATINLDPATFTGFQAVDNPASFKLELGGLDRLEVVRYLPDARWRRSISNDNPEPNPAIEITMPSTNGGDDRSDWMFGGQRGRLGSRKLTFRALTDAAAHRRWLEATTGSEATETARAASIEVVAGPEGSLHVRFHRKEAGAAPETVAIEPGRPIAAPWPDVKFRVSRFYPNARVTRIPVPSGVIGDERSPALLLRLHAGAENAEIWLPWFARQEVEVAGSPYGLRFKKKTVPLGFQVKLNRFRIGYYPGKRTIRGEEMGRPRSFESYITILDPATGGSRDRIVSMNNPASYGGFTFYQSSYKVDRGFRMTILSVSKNPDQPFVFAGYIITILGMLWVMVTRIREQRRLARLQAGVFGPGAPAARSEGG